MTIHSDVSGASTAITFAFSLKFAELAGLNEFPLPGLHLDSEKVSVTGLRIIVGFEIFIRSAIIFFDNVGEMRGRSPRAIGDKLE